ncbi:MAG TPA: MlaD family protein [Gammaproteobacteria bacterium]|nr:MlaD family protein [Gammaproteobacteria bacterium]
MDTKFNYFIVGFFVLFFTCVLIVWGAWIFSTGKGKSYTPYLVYMNESVSGLNANGPVKYNGVDVGYVAHIGIDKQNPKRVRLVLNIEKGTPITSGTTATMMTQGLTGIGYVGLKMLDPNKGPLIKLPGEEYPIINSAPSLFFRLDSSLTKLINSAENISNKVNDLLTPENRKAVSNIISNLDHITANISKQDLNKLDVILDNAAMGSEDLAAVMAQLNKTTHDIQRLTKMISENPAVLLRGQQLPPPGPGE